MKQSCWVVKGGGFPNYGQISINAGSQIKDIVYINFSLFFLRKGKP